MGRNGMEKGLELRVPQWMTQVCDYLNENESASWDWFSSVEAQSDYADTLKMELLKSTYRMSSGEHGELYKVGQEALEKLELKIPLTFYQSQTPGAASAAIYYLPGEAHVVFFGNILELLTIEEQKSIIAHELAHYKLWQENDGAYLIADRFLNAVASHSQVENSQLETARRYQLYTEIYADRGSLYVVEDLQTVISALVKVHTGMKQVSAVSYLEQANEIFSNGEVKTEGLSHPEAFIRARALQVYQDYSERLDEELDKMILGSFDLDELDLLQQALLSFYTECFVQEILEADWIKKKDILTNRLPLYHEPEIKVSKNLKLEDFFKNYSCKKLNEYFSYLLLDFVALDREELPAMALHCFEIAQKFGLAEVYEEKLNKELKVKKTDWKNWQKNKERVLAEALAGGEA